MVHARGVCVDGCDHEPVDAGHVEKCIAWIRHHAKRGSVPNRWTTSYGWKHEVEREHGYVSNGSLIVAAIREGYTPHEAGLGSPNLCFNMWPAGAAEIPLIRGLR